MAPKTKQKQPDSRQRTEEEQEAIDEHEAILQTAVDAGVRPVVLVCLAVAGCVCCASGCVRTCLVQLAVKFARAGGARTRLSRITSQPFCLLGLPEGD